MCESKHCHLSSLCGMGTALLLLTGRLCKERFSLFPEGHLHQSKHHHRGSVPSEHQLFPPTELQPHSLKARKTRLKHSFFPEIGRVRDFPHFPQCPHYTLLDPRNTFCVLTALENNKLPFVNIVVFQCSLSCIFWILKLQYLLSV